MEKIKFFMDFLSPYSYFAWENHKELIKSGLFFDYHPIMMTSLFKHFGISAPGLIPARRKYALIDCRRYSVKNNMPFHPPSTHPFNHLYCLRASSKNAGADNQFQIIDAIWDAIWTKSIVLDTPEKLSLSLDKAGLKGDIIVEKSFEQNSKKEIKDNIKLALELGVFGSPSFVTEQKEVFWGNDSLVYLKESVT